MTSDKDRRRNVHTYMCKSTTTNGGCGKVAVSGERVDELITDLVLKYVSTREFRSRRTIGSGRGALGDDSSYLGFDGSVCFRSAIEGGRLSLGTKAGGSRSGASSGAIRLLRERTAEAARPTNISELWPGLDIDHRREVIECFGSGDQTRRRQGWTFFARPSRYRLAIDDIGDPPPTVLGESRGWLPQTLTQCSVSLLPPLADRVLPADSATAAPALVLAPFWRGAGRLA